MAIASLIISTLIAIAVIYREFIHHRVFKPDIKVDFSLEMPISRTTIVDVSYHSLEPHYKNAFWPRLRITNNGNVVAKKCEGVLTEVRAPGGELDVRYDPITLRWAIAPLNQGLKPLDISAHRSVDLNTFFTVHGEPNARFATHPDARGIPLFLEPGDYWICIVIYGDNFAPKVNGYAIHWDGKDYQKVDVKPMQEIPKDITQWPWQLASI